MSCVCVITPVVVAAWPAFSTALVSAASALGYQVMADQMNPSKKEKRTQSTARSVDLEIPRSEIVTGQLDREQCLTVKRDDVQVTFARDARGRASLCVTGPGHTQEELRALGEELSRGVVQQYVYQRLKEAMAARQYIVVEEETDLNQNIRMKVRHWEE